MNRMQKLKEDIEIAMSMTGMGFSSASTILAEIGNYKDFETAEQLASWCDATIVSFSPSLLKYAERTSSMLNSLIRIWHEQPERAFVSYALNPGLLYSL